MARSLFRRLGIPDIARRITGFSTPFLGVQWNPPAAEREVVRGFLTYLEDQRTLISPDRLELHYYRSTISQFRRQCTECLAAIPENSKAVQPFRAIRAACRRFLDEDIERARFFTTAARFARRLELDQRFREKTPEVRAKTLRDIEAGESLAHEEVFFAALGELRASVGAQVGILAALYEIELEADLAALLPAEDKDQFP